MVHRIKISISLFILFVPLAKISFKLHPPGTGCDASKTNLHLVDMELIFHTALQGMKYLTWEESKICLSSGLRLLTYSTKPNSCNFLSASRTCALSSGFLSSLRNCPWYTFNATCIFGLSLVFGSPTNGNLATVMPFSILTCTLRSISDCSTSSWMLMDSIRPLFLHSERFRQSAHL